MIRYGISRAELEERVDSTSKRWRSDAKKKTAALRKTRTFGKTPATWSAIKQVYIDLQHGKCAYCERSFGTDEKSRIEHDVEHFRPKNGVKAWPGAGSPLKYDFPTGASSNSGYYLLAFNILNYMAACKKCNSPYKSNYFPVAQPRQVRTEDFGRLAREQPFLIYPVSDIDDDPEDLITFEGYVPAPKVAEGHGYRRARVTIDFFGLDLREELLRDRALLMKIIYVACEDLDHPNALRRRDARQTIDGIGNARLAHRNCARAFYALCLNNRERATAYYEAAIAYLDSMGYGS